MTTATKKRVRKSSPPNPKRAPPTVKAAEKTQSGASVGVVAVAPAAAPKAAKKAAAEPAKAAKKGLSAVATIRMVLATDPEASVEDIGKVLDKAGLSKPADTVRTIRSDFHGTYRALAKAGQLKNPQLNWI